MSSRSFLSNQHALFPAAVSRLDGSDISTPLPTPGLSASKVIGEFGRLPLKSGSAFFLGTGAVVTHLVLDRLYGSNSLVHVALTVDLFVFAIWVAAIGVMHFAKYILAQAPDVMIQYYRASLTYRYARHCVEEAASNPASIPGRPCICASGETFKSCCGKN